VQIAFGKFGQVAVLHGSSKQATGLGHACPAAGHISKVKTSYNIKNTDKIKKQKKKKQKQKKKDKLWKNKNHFVQI
jgi:hypothetical protein